MMIKSILGFILCLQVLQLVIAVNLDMQNCKVRRPDASLITGMCRERIDNYPVNCKLKCSDTHEVDGATQVPVGWTLSPPKGCGHDSYCCCIHKRFLEGHDHDAPAPKAEPSAIMSCPKNTKCEQQTHCRDALGTPIVVDGRQVRCSSPLLRICCAYP